MDLLPHASPGVFCLSVSHLLHISVFLSLSCSNTHTHKQTYTLSLCLSPIHAHSLSLSHYHPSAAGFTPAASGVGCEDIDECATGAATCTPGTYCSNREGSHECERCHQGCKSCTGAAATDCAECDPGYSRDGEGESVF